MTKMGHLLTVHSWDKVLLSFQPFWKFKAITGHFNSIRKDPDQRAGLSTGKYYVTLNNRNAEEHFLIKTLGQNTPVNASIILQSREDQKQTQRKSIIRLFTHFLEPDWNQEEAGSCGISSLFSKPQNQNLLHEYPNLRYLFIFGSGQHLKFLFCLSIQLRNIV